LCERVEFPVCRVSESDLRSVRCRFGHLRFAPHPIHLWQMSGPAKVESHQYRESQQRHLFRYRGIASDDQERLGESVVVSEERR
jgi:hypothetical protein